MVHKGGRRGKLEFESNIYTLLCIMCYDKQQGLSHIAQEICLISCNGKEKEMMDIHSDHQGIGHRLVYQMCFQLLKSQQQNTQADFDSHLHHFPHI